MSSNSAINLVGTYQEKGKAHSRQSNINLNEYKYMNISFMEQGEKQYVEIIQAESSLNLAVVNCSHNEQFDCLAC